MQKELPIKVLQVTIGDGSYGGVASFMYSYYSHMDHDRVHFDFLYCGENSLKSKENDAVLAGSKITTLHILKRFNNGISEYKRLLPELKKIFSENRYDIVHVNSGNVYLNVCVAYALRGRARFICHSHSIQSTIRKSGIIKSMIKSSVRKPCMHYIIKRADALYACSMAAGKNLFGERGVALDKFSIIHNAIDLSRFKYDVALRQKIRDGEGRKVIGYVGRMSDEKNPVFVVEIFSELHKMDADTVLWMIGEGPLKDNVEARIHELHLDDCAVAMGRRNDVAQLMQAMDALLLPSFYEGLSIVTVEAQAAGLPVFASDSISTEHNITELVTFFPLAEKAENWAMIINKTLKGIKDRKETEECMTEAGYEINTAAKRLENKYLQLCK